MRKFLLAFMACIILGSCTSVWAAVTSVTFSITSSARTSTPNLRVALQHYKLAREGSATGQYVQGAAIDEIKNYYLTKSVTLDLSTVLYWRATVDQDTKWSIDGTNYDIIYAGEKDGSVVFK